MVEESQCVKAFAAFLRFLYCNHVCLHSENTLSILILADKYNVNSLRKVDNLFSLNFEINTGVYRLCNFTNFAIIIAQGSISHLVSLWHQSISSGIFHFIQMFQIDNNLSN